MLIHNQGRYYFGPISFVMPDNVGVEIEKNDVSFESLRLFAPDGSFYILLHCIPVGDSAYDSISRYRAGLRSCLREREQLAWGPWQGYRFIYEDSRYVYEVYAVDIPYGKRKGLMELYVHIPKDAPVDNAAAITEVIAALLESLRCPPVTSIN